MRETIQNGLSFYHISLDERDLEHLCFYITELVRWNSKINLTGVKDIQRTIKDLLFDSFFLSGYVAGNHSVIDLGSGSGILGIPLSIINKANKVYSIDKSLRKIQFQRHIKRILNLTRFSTFHARAEDVKPLSADYLVAKAFGSSKEILDIGTIHVKKNGHALLLKGKNEIPVLHDKFSLENSIAYTLPSQDRSYTLLVYKKVSS
ncbi:MAG TPA: 16S rRNA (guanine(527)-N(7))-methyltransferase RsmG [Syntrophorhabdaceae bacterium]|nr:16S rRNA (guanine(527)-N(7))-methyltransferase RsmG [Syntrophorhabdaceae bacterium]